MNYDFELDEDKRRTLGYLSAAIGVAATAYSQKVRKCEPSRAEEVILGQTAKDLSEPLEIESAEDCSKPAYKTAREIDPDAIENKSLENKSNLYDGS